MSKIALAENTTKLKHWSQAIRDLEIELNSLRDEIVPQNHACIEPTYGEGDEIYYGHVKLLDKLVFNYNKLNENENGSYYWQIPEDIRNRIEYERNRPNKTIELAGGRWNDIIYHDGLFIAVGSHGRIIKSKDAKIWDDVHFLFSTKSVQFIINGNNVTDGVNTYSISRNGIFRATIDNETKTYTISYDETDTPISVTDGTNVYSVRDNKFTIGGNYLENSSDYNLYAIEWCGNCFVAVGSHNMFTYSFDGAYWWGPIYVGASYDANITQITTADLTNDIFTKNDIWYGIAYDELTKTIHLCGTQGRTLCGKFLSDVSDRFVFGETKCYFTNLTYNALNNMNLFDIKTMHDDNYTYVVACGNNNYVLSAKYSKNTNTLGVFEWNKMQIQDANNGTDTTTPLPAVNWNAISIQKVNEENAFILLGTNGKVVYSHTGIGDTWNVPPYNSNVDNFNINTMTGYNNLFVVAGDYANALNGHNIIRYNDNTTPEYTKLDEFGNEIKITLQSEIKELTEHPQAGQSSQPIIKHVSEKFPLESGTPGYSWFGSCYGKETFILVGDNNAIICCTLSEDASNYAISLEFYKNYIKTLEERINELEGRVITTNLEYKIIQGGTYTYGSEDTDETNVYNETISYSDGSILLYKTSGKVNLSFMPAPESIYREMVIYLKSLADTRLTISGGEWENDFYMPDWGRAGFNLALKAIFVDNRVIIQIIDNDQLADNILMETNNTNNNG